MPVESELKVTWSEFHQIMHLGGNTESDWSSCALRRPHELKAILGEERAAELIVLIETSSSVSLAPIRGSRVSQVRQPAVADTVPSPPPSSTLPTHAPPPMPPLPFPPPVSRVPPPKTHVPISPFSPTRSKPKVQDDE